MNTSAASLDSFLFFYLCAENYSDSSAYDTVTVSVVECVFKKLVQSYTKTLVTQVVWAHFLTYYRIWLDT